MKRPRSQKRDAKRGKGLPNPAKAKRGRTRIVEPPHQLLERDPEPVVRPDPTPSEVDAEEGEA